MKQLMTGVVAALAMGVMAEIINTVKVTKFHQSYPYSGKATVEYTVGGTLPRGENTRELKRGSPSGKRHSCCFPECCFPIAR